MKVSKAKQAEIRRQLVSTACELFGRQGLAETSMRDISTRAGFAATTIYNYFPSREKIFYAYFAIKLEDLALQLDEITDFTEYAFKEKLQILLESLLDLYRPEREFVRLAYRSLFDSPLRSYSEFTPIKSSYLELVRAAHESAKSTGELPDRGFDGTLIAAFWEYTQLIIFYWLADDSPGGTRTSQLIDVSLDLVVELFRSGVIARTIELVSFLLKSHLYGNAQRFGDIVHLLAQTLPKSADTPGGRARTTRAAPAET